jgi:hypothetical protein
LRVVFQVGSKLLPFGFISPSLSRRYFV